MLAWLTDPFAIFPAEGPEREESKFYVYETFLSDVYPERAVPGNAYHDSKARGYTWGAYSVGPMGVTVPPWLPWMFKGQTSVYTLDDSLGGLYDPTNGTKSMGKIARTNKGEVTGGEVAAGYR